MDRQSLLEEALASGERTKSRLLRVLQELAPCLPMTASSVEALDWFGQLRTDGLLLQFNNLVAVVQDQLIRNVLLASEEPVQRLSRIDQRHVAEKIGALPEGIDFQAIVDARNGIAHQYPADLNDQALVINKVAEAAPHLLRAFDALATFVRERLVRET